TATRSKAGTPTRQRSRCSKPRAGGHERIPLAGLFPARARAALPAQPATPPPVRQPRLGRADRAVGRPGARHGVYAAAVGRAAGPGPGAAAGGLAGPNRPRPPPAPRRPGRPALVGPRLLPLAG